MTQDSLARPGSESDLTLGQGPPLALERLAPRRHRWVLGFLYGMVRRHRGLVAACLAANVGASVLEGTSMSLLYLAVSVLMQEAGSGGAAAWLAQAVEGLVGAVDRWTLFVLLVGSVAFSQILQSSLSFAAFSLSALLRMRVRRETMTAIAHQIMDLSFPAISRYKAGELWSQMTLGKGIEKLMAVVNDGIYTILMALAYTAFLLALSWPMTLAALLVFGLLTLGLRTVMARINAIAGRLLRSMRDVNSVTADFLAGMRLIRSFGIKKRSLATLAGYIDESSRLTALGSIWQAALSPIIDVVTVLTLAGAMLAMSLVFGDRITEALPTVLVFVFVMARLMPRLGHINKLRANLREYWPTVIYTVDFLSRDDKEFVRKDGLPFAGLRDGIEFRDVRLDYVAGERPALVDVSFRVGRGETVALVGESGAGKSSVVDLVLGLYDPTAGEVRVDGVPLTRLDPESWRQRIGVVGQDTFLFPASIRDNIAFGKPDAGEAEIVAAAKLAHAHEFVSRLDRGYDTVLGDRGYRLSGGQCQRLALARAILRAPDVLLLDEATSDLDSHSERLIQDALDGFRKDRTVIIVAHRLSTVRDADRILVIHEGRLVEQGTHAELVARGGRYAGLWRLQSSAPAA
jgi:ATP-binding cassette subfamily B protein/subfamily B ATP-binding cassette protein MsbA